MSAPRWILLADDDASDAQLVLRAVAAEELPAEIVLASDGAEAMDCLCGRGAFHQRVSNLPVVIVLDLNMPRMDGLEALQQIKGDPRLKRIPVVIFTSSQEECDVTRCYELGANAYVVKPVDSKQFINVVRNLCGYWTQLNVPPPSPPGKAAPGTLPLAAQA